MRLFDFKAKNWERGIALLEEDVLGKEKGLDHLVVEKRGTTRVEMSVPVRYRLLEEKNQWKVGDMKDLAVNGVRLAIQASVTVGTCVDLEIELPNASRPIRIKGIVVWIAPSFSSGLITFCGIAFKDLKEVSGSEEMVYFMADKFCELALRSDSALASSPVQSPEELKATYRIVYKEYLSKGYCQANPSQMQYNFQSILPESCTFVLKKAERLLGTLTLVVDSPCGLPIESLFPSEIAKLRARGKRLAEVSLLALDLEAIGKGSFSLANFQKQTILFRLMKTMSDYAYFVAGVTDLIFGVHPKHELLYRYMTGEVLASTRSYRGACGNPALPMRINIKRGYETPPRAGGFWSYILTNPTPKEVLNSRFRWTSEAACEFLMNERPLWEKLSPSVQAHLKSCYPSLVPG